MNQDDVPQDQVPYYGAARRAVYAVDRDGHYTTVPSSGWDAESVVNADAVAEFERLAQAAHQRVVAGISSPLEYHMYARRMDPPTLAQVAGVWRWTLNRHLKPRGFARLSARKLQRYADALGLAPETLKVAL